MNYIKKISIPLVLILISYQAMAQKLNAIEGIIYGIDNQQEKTVLIGANIYWAGTTIGTVSDKNGKFQLENPQNNLTLVASYMGFKADTIQISSNQSFLEITLKTSYKLKEVIITDRRGSSFYSKASTFQIQTLTSNELKKAACCNLSESFETNASVDVSYPDAITGAKQIELLGLAGIYTQMQMENVPSIRGLASSYGLNFVPGPWLESIQISKGTSSVKNGFESITGQINYEFKKPDTSEKFYFNLFGNELGRTEMNAYSAKKINKQLSTMTFIHGNYFGNKVDRNNDKFLDIPTQQQINVLNRWSYFSDRLETRFGVSYMAENKATGQTYFNESTDRGTTNAYGVGIDTRKLDGFLKLGIFNKKNPNSSIGIITSGSYYDQKSYFGLNKYDAWMTNAYANVIYQSIIKNTNNNFVTGFSFIFDHYDQIFNDSAFVKSDIVPGAFFEYTYKKTDKFALIAGIRDDYHLKYGNLFTPRLHLRYKLNKNNILRASAGKGYRFSNVLAENTALMVTSKTFVFENEPTYEEAWNYGVFYTHDFIINKRALVLNMDFYRTDFTNQIIIDMDICVDLIHVYNLDGKSYSNSFQTELIYEPFDRFKIMMAYRYNDVKTTYFGTLKDKLMSKKGKAILNLSYATPWEKWKFDYTLQYNGSSRLPVTFINDTEYIQEYSPSFIIMNAQISKNFKHFELYLGVENLTNFVQKDPIIAYTEPFSSEFDASKVWGPILGRKLYGGLRYIIK